MEEAKLREDGAFDGIVGEITDRFPPERLRQQFTVDEISKYLRSNRYAKILLEANKTFKERVHSARRVLETLFDPFFKYCRTDTHGNDRKLLWKAVFLGNEELKFTGVYCEDTLGTNSSGKTPQGQDQTETTGDFVHTVRLPYSAIERKATDKIFQPMIMFYLSLCFGLLPFAIIGPLSHFNDGESTKVQRGWTMAWLVVGNIFGHYSYETIETLSNSVASRALSFNFVKIPLLKVLLYGAATVGGMVVVGQMLVDYGNCVRMY